MPSLLVGRVQRAHGLRGEVVVDLLSSEEVRLAPGSELDGGAAGVLRVVSSRPHQERWLVTFDGIGTREAAEALRGVELRAEAMAGDGDELWLHELLGASVVDAGGAACGRVVEVHANPASDLLELETGALVPVVFVQGWDGEGAGRRLVIDPPDGLLDLTAD